MIVRNIVVRVEFPEGTTDEVMDDFLNSMETDIETAAEDSLVDHCNDDETDVVADATIVKVNRVKSLTILHDRD